MLLLSNDSLQEIAKRLSQLHDSLRTIGSSESESESVLPSLCNVHQSPLHPPKFSLAKVYQITVGQIPHPAAATIAGSQQRAVTLVPSPHAVPYVGAPKV